MYNKPRNVYVVYHVFTRDFVSAYSSESKAKDACCRLNSLNFYSNMVDYKFKRLTVI